MELPQIEVIGSQPLEAFIEEPQRAIARAVVGLGGQKTWLRRSPKAAP